MKINQNQKIKHHSLLKSITLLLFSRALKKGF